jgi:hypothetical protein
MDQINLEYSRASQAAERVLVDLGQVLASYMDRMVLVGGLSPSLLFASADPPHSGSIDVDVALKAEALLGGDYARLIECLLDTGRYFHSSDPNQRFRFYTEVDLKDGNRPIRVPVDFLAQRGLRLRSKGELEALPFRVLQADGCDAAFIRPEQLTLKDKPNAQGHLNTVTWKVVGVGGLLLMKSFALAGREKAKDAYDIVFCLQQVYEQGLLSDLVKDWATEHNQDDVLRAFVILEQKFKTPNHVGPRWYAEFLAEGESDVHARFAFEIVQKVLASRI